MKMRPIERWCESTDGWLHKMFDEHIPVETAREICRLGGAEISSLAYFALVGAFSRRWRHGKVTVFCPVQELIDCVDAESAPSVDDLADLKMFWPYETAFIEVKDGNIGGCMLVRDGDVIEFLRAHDMPADVVKQVIDAAHFDNSTTRDFDEGIVFVPITLKMLEHEGLESLKDEHSACSDDELDRASHVMASVYTYIVNASTRTDVAVEYTPTSDVVTKTHDKKRRSKSKIIKVGTRLGEAVRLSKKRASDSYDTHTGRTQTPHLVRGHYHRYRVGPRNDWHYEWRLLAPYWTTGNAKPQNVVRHVEI